VTETRRQKKSDREAALDALITEIEASQAGSMQSWNEFADVMKVPQDFFPALLTGRTELIDAVQPRDMTAEEVGHLLAVLKTLLKTNFLLREHAEQVSQMVGNWSDAFVQLNRVGGRIERFATFKSIRGDENDDGGEA
jgi:hypothetical protein